MISIQNITIRELLYAFANSLVLLLATAHASEHERQSAPSFKKVMIVVLENTDYADALAQPFLGNLAKRGALLTGFYAEPHPSLPNCIAMTAGTFTGVSSNRPVNLDVRHIGHLLEAPA